MSTGPLATPSRILLLRTSALGDLVHSLPVLTALRRHLPATRLGWVVEEAFAPLLVGHPDLDEVIVARFRSWRHRPLSKATRSEIRELLHRVDAFGADVVLDLMGNHKAALLAALSFSDRRIGLARAHRREPASAAWINEPVVPEGEHVVDRTLSLLAPLGLPTEAADFGGERLLTRVPAAAGQLLEETSKPYLLIHPGAGWANKRYPAPAWGAVAARLGRLTGLNTLVVAGPSEEPLARQVAAASGGFGRPVFAPSLPFLGALLRGCRLAMGGDTGPVHLARALGTRVLCLMGPTDPRRHGPYGAPEQALWHRLPCSFCYQRLAETKACLLELTPEAVAARAAELL